MLECNLNNMKPWKYIYWYFILQYSTELNIDSDKSSSGFVRWQACLYIISVQKVKTHC